MKQNQQKKTYNDFSTHVYAANDFRKKKSEIREISFLKKKS